MKKKKKKILLIEDEKMLVEMYNKKFIQAGFEVILAFTAEEGLKLAKKEKPDLILLDILLPKKNGISFMKSFKRKYSISSIPVIAFSNYDDPITIEEARGLGIKEYLLKANYTPEEIVKKIKSYLK